MLAKQTQYFSQLMLGMVFNDWYLYALWTGEGATQPGQRLGLSLRTTNAMPLFSTYKLCEIISSAISTRVADQAGNTC